MTIYELINNLKKDVESANKLMGILAHRHDLQMDINILESSLIDGGKTAYINLQIKQVL